MPLATSTPHTPNLKAASTSLPSTIPAPHMISTYGFFAAALTDSVITSGLALETATPDPMSSGGSIAI